MPPSNVKSWCLAGVLPLTKQQVPREVLAGLTLAAIAIPEVMGYTKISGTPVVTGLYTLLVPMALFALFASSRHLVVGADSATAAILATSLAGLAVTGSTHYVALAGLLALMVGLLLLVASVARIGFMADFLSRTVLTGFLTGVGLQVALHSVGGMTGVHLPHASGLDSLAHLSEVSARFNPADVFVSIGVLAVILGLRTVSKSIPGPIIALTLAILASWFWALKDKVAVVGSVPGGLPDIVLPEVDLSMSLIWQLGPTALAMLVVILAQSAATARAYAAKYRDHHDESADLRGLGLAKLGAGLTGTFVVNGSPTKSQMVESAGGRTQLSMLVTSAVVLLVLLFFTELLSDLPEAALSALVFLIGVDLIDLKGMMRIYRTRRAEFWVSLATICVVVGAGVGPGIMLAIVLSLIVHTRHGYRPLNVLLAQEPSGPWQAKPLRSAAEAVDGLMVYRFTHSLYYANADRMAAEIRTLIDGKEGGLHLFCIDFSCMDDIDYTALETLKALQGELQDKGMELLFAHMLDDPDAPVRGQLIKAFGKTQVFATLAELTAYAGKVDKR